MLNILTVDVEEWYDGNDFDLTEQRRAGLESRVVPQTDRLLDLLESTGARATFFVLGSVATRHPELVRRIQARGHEVGAHGLRHDLLYRLTRDQLQAQIQESLRVLASLTGEPVTAFRAPSWSITERNPWALDVLRACGITADSSIFPMRTWMYGVKNARLDIHEIASDGAGPPLVEYPPAAMRLGGLTLPVAGGIFFRLLPYPLTRSALRRINAAGRPAVVYLHPWELDPDQPRLPDMPFRRTWYHYWGLGRAGAKYTRLLSDFRFGSIRQHRQGSGGEGVRR